MLPIVNKEIINSIKDNAKDIEFIKSSWIEMAMENIDLFDAVSDSSKQFPTRSSQEAFLRGAFLAWVLLYKQDEVDDMNKNWGV